MEKNYKYMFSLKYINIYVQFNSSQFAITKCLFGVVSLTINAIKRKFFYYGYQIAFDGASSWSFLMNLLKMLMFSFDNSLQDVNVDKTFLKMQKIFFKYQVRDQQIILMIMMATLKNKCGINFTKSKILSMLAL